MSQFANLSANPCHLYGRVIRCELIIEKLLNRITVEFSLFTILSPICLQLNPKAFPTFILLRVASETGAQLQEGKQVDYKLSGKRWTVEENG